MSEGMDFFEDYGLDGFHDDFEDLAAASGWTPCAACGEWMDRSQLVDIEDNWYCAKCAKEVTGDD